MKKSIIICCAILMLFITSASSDKLEYKSSAMEPEEQVSFEFSESVSNSGPTSEHLKIMLNLINEERIANKLEPLEWNGELYLAALTRAQEVSVKWSPIRPDETLYSTVNELVKSENVVKGCKAPEEALEALMNSEIHRQKLLNKNTTIIGIALYVYNGEYYWVQELG